MFNMTYTTIKLRRGTAAEWTATNPTLALGEYGYETDTRKSKIGDGTTKWNSLPYLNIAADYIQIEGGQSVTGGMRFVGKLDIEGDPLSSTRWTPASGTWVTDDIVQDVYGGLWQCTSGGSPGTWKNMSPQFTEQLQTELQYFASYISGGPVTLSATPSNLPLADASRMPIPPTGTSYKLIIGTGVYELEEPNRILAYYTGRSGNYLTGVVTRDGTSQVAADGLKVWYGESALSSGYMRIPNGIIARSAEDGRAHDLVLCAAYDDERPTTGVAGTGRADYDIVVSREPGSFGRFVIAMPIRFPQDTEFTDGSGSTLLTFAGSVEADSNKMNSNPLPTGTIAIHGRLQGASASTKSLVLKNGDLTTSRIEFQSSGGTRIFSVNDSGPELSNNTQLRLRRNDTGFGGITVSSSNTLSIRGAGGNIQFTNYANDAALMLLSDNGILTLNGSSSLAGATVGTVNATLSASSGTQYGLVVAPTLTQSGTASYTALRINATETSVGSGAKKLIDAQAGGTSRFIVSNDGTVNLGSPDGALFGAMFVSNSSSFVLRAAGANGILFNNSTNTQQIFKVDNTGIMSISGTTATVRAGSGSPESAVSAAVGSLYLRTDGASGTTLYVKESGSGTTGWVAK